MTDKADIEFEAGRLADDFLFRAAASIQRNEHIIKQTVGEIGDKSQLMAALVNVQGLIYHADVCGPRTSPGRDSIRCRRRVGRV